MERIYIAGGCLWGVQQFFKSIPGVLNTEAGRANGCTNSLDGEYYWINESRNEVAFTISGNKGNINKGEADAFTIDKDSSTIELTGSNIINRKENYTFKNGVFTVDISGTKQDYYKKDSEAYKEAVKKYGNKQNS